MEWNKDRSIVLSIVCVVVFAILLLAADLTAPLWIDELFCFVSDAPVNSTLCLISIYAASVFAWICLFLLWKLLHSLQRGEVFTEENIRRLRGISWCCAAVAVVFLISMMFSLLFFVMAAAAAFMMLIVRIVKNIFQQAAEMKSDLDLTI